MNKANHNIDVTFIYDGECPICTNAAHALRIKSRFGGIRLLNAREATNDPLMAEVNKQGFDLDEGMVIHAEKRFYHGKMIRRLSYLTMAEKILPLVR